MVTIRPRTAEDLDSCIEVLRHVYDKDGYPVQGTKTAKAFLTQAHTQQAWIAERDSQIIGHVAVSEASEKDVSVKLWRKRHPDVPIAVLERLFVDPEGRGGGVASKLMAATVDWARERQIRLVLFGLIKDQGAIRLYERLGWVEFGKTEFRWGDGQSMEATCFASPDFHENA